MQYNIPRIVVGAAQGRSGKTTFTLGLLRALYNRGYKMQPFKKGPDYIDPSWMTFASGGVECRNLDAFMMDKEQIKSTFIKHSLNKDISIIEGAMGLFDGLDVEGSNSTAEIANMLEAPIILVVNCQRITRSVAALINGITGFDKRLKFGGVVLNNVARARHQNIMTGAIEKYCDIEILGAIPKSSDIEIPDRHLGLIPAGEMESLQKRVDKLGSLIGDNVNIERILEIAKNAKPLEAELKSSPIVIEDKKCRIGVLRDRAFSFYYPENIEALAEAGAEIVYIDSMKDQHLPDIAGMYIGGGFPEVMAEEISANKTLMAEVKAKAEKGMPIYAECGGLMYLCRNIINNDRNYSMVGLFDCDVQMEKKPQGHGYAIQEALADQVFFEEGEEILGHEFHNSRIVNLADDVKFAYKTKRGKGIRDGYDGLCYKNVLACYHHLHAASVEDWAVNFVKLANKFIKNK